MNPLKCEKLRISLKAYESPILDQSCQKIIEAIKASGLEAIGPVPMPTKIRRYCVLTSPHVNKKAREQFELSSFKRLLDIYSSSSKTIDALMKLELPSGVEVEIKV